MKKRFLLCFLLLGFGILLIDKFLLFSNQKQIFKTYKEVREFMMKNMIIKMVIIIIIILQDTQQVIDI